VEGKKEGKNRIAKPLCGTQRLERKNSKQEEGVSHIAQQNMQGCILCVHGGTIYKQLYIAEPKKPTYHAIQMSKVKHGCIASTLNHSNYMEEAGTDVRGTDTYQDMVRHSKSLQTGRGPFT